MPLKLSRVYFFLRVCFRSHPLKGILPPRSRSWVHDLFPLEKCFNNVYLWGERMTVIYVCEAILLRNFFFCFKNRRDAEDCRDTSYRNGYKEEAPKPTYLDIHPHHHHPGRLCKFSLVQDDTSWGGVVLTCFVLNHTHLPDDLKMNDERASECRILDAFFCPKMVEFEFCFWMELITSNQDQGVAWQGFDYPNNRSYGTTILYKW